jgi:hypothetical protein
MLLCEKLEGICPRHYVGVHHEEEIAYTYYMYYNFSSIC